jgi:hypothetical protein
MAKKKIDPAKADELKTAYYDAMRQGKRDAGLRLEDAVEVTARQQAEDEASQSMPWLEEETEQPPES